MQVLGIHITPYSIYAVSLRTADAKPVVTGRTSIPLSLEWDDSQRKTELVLKLKELHRKHPQHYFVFTVPQTQVSIHDLKFPFTEKFKINKALPFEIEDKIPFSDMVYSSKVCYRSPAGSSVLSFVSSKPWMMEFLELLQSAGIQADMLIPESSALCNLFEEWKSSPPQLSPPVSGDQLKLYLSYRQSIAFVQSQERVLLIHNLNWGFQSCVQEIAAKYKRDMDQALKYFFENSILTHEDMDSIVPLSKIIKNSFKSLSHHLRLLLIYLKGAGHSSIKDIALLGPGSVIQNLSYHLYEAVKIPVHKWEDERAEPPEHMVSLGTAYEAFKKPKNPPINLMPHIQEERIKITKKKLTFLKALALGVIVFSGYIGVRNWKADALTVQMNQIFSNYARRAAGLKTRSISIQNVEKFLKQKKQNNETSRAFKSLGQLPSALDFLKQFSFSFDPSNPWNMEVSRFEIKNRQVDIQGTIEKQYLQPLLQHLKSISSDGKVEQKKTAGLEKQDSPESVKKPVKKPEEKSLDTQIEELSTALSDEAPSNEQTKSTPAPSVENRESFHVTLKLKG